MQFLELLIGEHFSAFRVRIWFRKFDGPVEGRAKLLTDSKVDNAAQ